MTNIGWIQSSAIYSLFMAFLVIGQRKKQGLK